MDGTCLIIHTLLTNLLLCGVSIKDSRYTKQLQPPLCHERAVGHGGVRQVYVETIPGVATDIINELDKTCNLSASQFLKWGRNIELVNILK